VPVPSESAASTPDNGDGVTGDTGEPGDTAANDNSTIAHATAESTKSDNSTSDSATSSDETSDNATSDNATSGKEASDDVASDQGTSAEATSDNNVAGESAPSGATADGDVASETPATEPPSQATAVSGASASSTDSTQAPPEIPTTPHDPLVAPASSSADAAPSTAIDAAGPVPSGAEPVAAAAGEVQPGANLGDLATDTPPSEPVALAPSESVAVPTPTDAASGSALPTGAPSPDAPAWVLHPPDRYLDDPAVVLVSDPCESALECDRDIDMKIQREFQNMALDVCHRLRTAHTFIPVSDAAIQSVKRDRYSTLRPTSFGEMRQVYQLIVFDEGARAQIEQTVRQVLVTYRLRRTAGLSMLAVGVVMSLLVPFRFLAGRTADPLAVHTA
jgi:hypothetical protein